MAMLRPDCYADSCSLRVWEIACTVDKSLRDQIAVDVVRYPYLQHAIDGFDGAINARLLSMDGQMLRGNFFLKIAQISVNACQKNRVLFLPSHLD